LRAADETRFERAPRALLTFFKAPAGSLESILAAGETGILVVKDEEE
jgi:hypothetical protein